MYLWCGSAETSRATASPHLDAFLIFHPQCCLEAGASAGGPRPAASPDPAQLDTTHPLALRPVATRAASRAPMVVHAPCRCGQRGRRLREPALLQLLLVRGGLKRAGTKVGWSASSSEPKMLGLETENVGFRI